MAGSVWSKGKRKPNGCLVRPAARDNRFRRASEWSARERHEGDRGRPSSSSDRARSQASFHDASLVPAQNAREGGPSLAGVHVSPWEKKRKATKTSTRSQPRRTSDEQTREERRQGRDSAHDPRRHLVTMLPRANPRARARHARRASGAWEVHTTPQEPRGWASRSSSWCRMKVVYVLRI